MALDETLVDESAPPAPARPSIREWSAEVELLAAIFDRMNTFIQTQASKDLKLKPWPSPVTAAEILSNYRRRERRSRLERLVTEAQERARQLEN